MNNNRLAIAAAVFLVLGGLTAYTLMKRSEQRNQPAAEVPSLPKVDREKVTSFEIRRPGEETIRLEKKDGSWRIAAPLDAMPDMSAVNGALDKLAELEVTSVAARNKENHEVLEVSDAKAVRVIVKAGNDTVLDVLIGSYRSGNTMVREAGKDPVLSVKGSIKWAFNKALKDWRDKTITGVQSDSVKTLELRNGESVFRFVRDGETWKQAEGERAIERFDGSKVQTLVGSIAALRAMEFAAPATTAAEAGLTDASPSVLLTTDGEAGVQQVRLRLGAARGEGDRERYLQRDGNEVIFVISKSQADRLAPTAESFQAPPDAGVAAPAPAAAEGDPGTPREMDPSQLPPEIMQQLQQQLRQQGMGGGGGGGGHEGHGH